VTQAVNLCTWRWRETTTSYFLIGLVRISWVTLVGAGGLEPLASYTSAEKFYCGMPLLAATSAFELDLERKC